MDANAILRGAVAFVLGFIMAAFATQVLLATAEYAGGRLCPLAAEEAGQC